MADDQTFEVLLKEFRRVGVDPDAAGPSAFLAQLRKNGHSPVAESVAAPATKRDRHRQDKSA